MMACRKIKFTVMRKYIRQYVISLLILVPFCFYGQKYGTQSGVVKFEASVPSFEEVAAQNKTVSALLNTDSGDIAALVLMKGFRFKVALMEEHFNESYAETNKYPKAVFKGKLEGFNFSSLTSGPKDYIINGELTKHGRTKKIKETAQVYKLGDKIIVSGNFILTPSEFGIDIPKLVSKKVAEKVNVSYSFTLGQQ